MNKPLLYFKHNGIPRRDSIFLLKNYLGLLKWKNNGEEAVLDIGCGPGDVTENVLLPVLPKKISKLVGIDKSDEMINFAESQRKSNKIIFKQFDISSEKLPIDLANNFDHAFSFHCLNWVLDQRKALRNILTMLKPGGEMLIMFSITHPVFEIYESMSKNKRWEPYVNNYKEFLSPYHHSKNPVDELEDHLSKVGFQSHLCKIEKRVHIFSSVSKFNKFLTAISPFSNTIPENQWEDYLNDYLDELKNFNFTEKNYINNETRINLPCKLFVVHASRPI